MTAHPILLLATLCALCTQQVTVTDEAIPAPATTTYCMMDLREFDPNPAVKLTVNSTRAPMNGETPRHGEHAYPLAPRTLFPPMFRVTDAVAHGRKPPITPYAADGPKLQLITLMPRTKRGDLPT